MTLLDPALVAALEDAASLTPKGPMLVTLQALDAITPITKTAAQWTADAATVLAIGQRGLESDTRLFKFGNGSDVWAGLSYAGGGDGDVIVQDLREWSSGTAVTVYSSAGVITPVWATHFDNSQTVHLERAGGDATAGPLLVRFPAFPGAGRAARTVQYEPTVATMATTSIAVAGVSYINSDGVAVLTTPAGTVGALNLEAGDALTGADFTNAVIATIAGDVITANVAASQEATATVSFTVPGSTIDGQRRINLPERPSGALFGLEAKTLPTATALGVVQTTAGLGSATAIAFDPAESGAIGPTVQTMGRNLGDRVLALESSPGGGIGEIVTLPDAVKTADFDLDISNASYSVRAGKLHAGTIIPVDTTAGDITATIAGNTDLAGASWALRVFGPNKCFVARPAVWEFDRIGNATAENDILAITDRTGILAGMAVRDDEENVLAAGTTVLDPNPGANQIQISANALISETDVTFIFDAGVVGTIDGIAGSAELRQGMNLVDAVAADPTTGGLTVETSAKTNAARLVTVAASREFAPSDIDRTLLASHATVAIALTLGTAMADAEVGATIVVRWRGVAAVSLAESGSGDIDKRTSDSLSLAEAGSAAVLVHEGGNTWLLTGDMEAAA